MLARRGEVFRCLGDTEVKWLKRICPTAKNSKGVKKMAMLKVSIEK